MREIYVNGVEFRYKTERDLSIILRHARQPARLGPLIRLCAEIELIKQNSSAISAVSNSCETSASFITPVA